MKKIALNINFDSLYFPLSINRMENRDPTFFKVADRFLETADAHNFKCSLFVIGRDLENPEVAARVKYWHDAGHEIGNHSWTHHGNLGATKPEKQRDEIKRTHEKITNTIGVEPRGYISPTWSMSPTSIQTLLDLKYVYDTSAFPSPIMLAAIAKLKFNSRTDQKFDANFLSRNDKKVLLYGTRKPYLIRPENMHRPNVSGLLMLPVPTVTPLRLPVWHTMSFMWPKKMHKAFITKAIQKGRGFYYLMHPADIASYEEDFDPDIVKQHEDELAVFERMDTPLREKLAMFEEVIAHMAGQAEFVTMRELADDIIQNRTYAKG